MKVFDGPDAVALRIPTALVIDATVVVSENRCQDERYYDGYAEPPAVAPERAVRSSLSQAARSAGMVRQRVAAPVRGGKLLGASGLRAPCWAR